MQKLFIENPDNKTFEANDPDYVCMAFLYKTSFLTLNILNFRKHIWKILIKSLIMIASKILC